MEQATIVVTGRPRIKDCYLWMFFLLLFSSVNEELYANGHFETMSIDTDEDEHSIEMQLPFIAKVMER